jgi:adenylosuccinate lyase
LAFIIIKVMSQSLDGKVKGAFVNSQIQRFQHPLSGRYASSSMQTIFSEFYKAVAWRKIWVILADEQRRLGLPISKTQVQQMEKGLEKVKLERVVHWESKLKHDVMAHLKAFAEVAPKAEPILHLGATSAFVTDNAEALIMRSATELLQSKLLVILKALGQLSLKYSDLEMTGYTHFQPAQPVTLGKRLALWAQDLLWDYEELSLVLQRYRPLGCKGTTGTQASFMVLFDNDFKKVTALDRAVVAKMGFKSPVGLSGQTLSRKMDVWFVHALANLAASISKLSYDLRLLQHLGELKEPFGSDQVGSSAMPYKQNPMMAERMTGLSRHIMTLSQNTIWTHSVQWLERSLDDSANRRLTLPEAFLTADALLETLHRLVKGMRVEERNIRNHLDKHRAAFETEALMMEETLKGRSRQEMHEEIRKEMLQGSLKAKGSRWKLSGASGQQVRAFCKLTLTPALNREWKRLKPSEDIFGSPSV